MGKFRLRGRGFFLRLALAALPATLPSQARPNFRDGDWNSSGGAPVPPYEPPYEYLYDCQAQISDQITRGEDKRSFELFAIADFQISNEQTYVSAPSLRWQGIKYFGPGETTVYEGPLPFAPAQSGTGFGLEVWPDDSTKVDRVFLDLSLEQPLGDYALRTHAREIFSRHDADFESTLWVNLEHRTQTLVPRYLLRVLCTKTK